MTSPQDRRLRTALAFSATSLVGVSVISRVFDVGLEPGETHKALAMIVPAMGLALCSVFASWLLVASLLERRPALHDRQGRWLWAWTVVFCLACLALALLNSASHTIGQVILYGSGLLVAVIGGVGLMISAMPRWNHRASGP